MDRAGAGLGGTAVSSQPDLGASHLLSRSGLRDHGRGRLAGRGVPPALPSPRGWGGRLRSPRIDLCGWGLIRGDAGRWSGRWHGVGLGGERRGLRWHRGGGRAPARLRPCRPFLRLRDLRFVVPVVVARRVVEEAEWGVAAGIFGSRAVLGRASPRGDEGGELVRGALHRRVLRFPDRCFMNDARYAGSVTVIGRGGSVVVARRRRDPSSACHTRE